MTRIRSWACGLVLSALSAQAWPANDALILRLFEQAQYWQQKERGDLAAESLRKLLRAEPNHPGALVQLGVIEARAGRDKEANDLYSRAKQLTPPPTGLGELEMALKIGKGPNLQLAKAREQAQSGEAEVAVKNYKELLGNAKPVGQFGLEYYQTLGATREGWDEARRGLKELVLKHPGEAGYQLALARHLTYREPTRREGILLLARLASNGETATQAQTAWRQALVWLDGRASDRALYAAYLSRFSDDAAMRDRLSAVQRPTSTGRANPAPDPQTLARQTGFSLLEAGDIASAESQFLSILASKPHDVDALGGLGLVRLRQKAFQGAVNLLDLAMSESKQGAPRWKSARESALYWALLNQVLAAREAGKLLSVEEQLSQALRIDGNEVLGQVLMGELSVEQRDLVKTESSFRRALAIAPKDPGALRGLLSVLMDSGREQETLTLLAALDADDEQKLGGVGRMKAAVLLKRAATQEQAQDYQAAAASLEAAMLFDPISPWPRLALARQHQRMGNIASASALLNSLLEENPDKVEVLHARALLYAEQRQWSSGAQVLGRIPPASRSAQIAGDLRWLQANAQIQRAQTFFAQGQTPSAYSAMDEAEVAAGHDPGLRAAVAGGWSALGQHYRAERMVRAALDEKPTDNVDMRIQYAGILLNARQDSRLSILLRELSVQRLSASQHAGVNELILVLTVRTADRLREAARITEARDTVTTALGHSDDPRLRMALARIFDSAGESRPALAVAEKEIALKPSDLEYRLFAVGVALSAQALDRAANHAKAALDIAPDDARALTLAGRVEKARGNSTSALAYFRRAQAGEDRAGAPRVALGSPAALSDEASVRSRATSPDATNGRYWLQPLPQSSVVSASIPDADLRLARRDSSVVDTINAGRSNLIPVPTYNLSASSDILTKRREDEGNLDTHRQVAQISSDRDRDAAMVAPAPPPPAVRGRSNRQEIDEIQLQLSNTLEAGVGFRNRSGQSGFGRLSQVDIPLEAKIPLGGNAAITLRLTSVMLSAGRLALSDPATAARFGLGALGALAVNGLTSTNQEVNGVAYSAGYSNDGFALDIGATPSMQNASKLVGGMTLSGQVRDLAVKGGLSRRAVNDSLLSYVGARDPQSGLIWGGVLKTGVRIDTTLGDDKSGLYGSFGSAILTGQGVKSNTETEATLGAYWRAYHSPDTKLTIGLNMNALRFRDNLGFFTLGHGGYFSPQSYLSLGAPIDVEATRGRWSLKLGGELSVRHISQDRSPFYPNDPSLQAAWEAKVASTPSPASYSTYYNAESQTGLGYNVVGSFEYRLSQDLLLGGRIAFDNSRNFSQLAGGVYLRYAFDGMSQQPSLPPSPPSRIFIGNSP